MAEAVDPSKKIFPTRRRSQGAGFFSEKKDKMIMPVTQASIKQCADLGCHACRLTFSPSDVSEWVEGEATCPHCGSDAVIGGTEPIDSMPIGGFADMLAKVFSGR